jgi:hypothetical protein
MTVLAPHTELAMSSKRGRGEVSVSRLWSPAKRVWKMASNFKRGAKRLLALGAASFVVAGMTAAVGNSVAGAASCDAYAGDTLTSPTAVTVSPVPIASPGSLPAGGSANLRVVATDAAGNCLSGAPIYLYFKGYGSAYPGTVARCPVGGTGSLTPNWAQCTTDTTGTVPVVYLAASPLPNGGSAELLASAGPPPAPAYPQTSYVYGSLTVSPIAITATEGQAFSGAVANVTTNNLANSGELKASVDWGDGTVGGATLASTGTATYQVTGQHVYREPPASGSYVTKITVFGPSGPTAAANGSASVVDAPLTATGTTLTGKARRLLTATLATFTDANPYGTADEFTATIAWGDGSTSPGTISTITGGFAVNGAHTYAKRGTYSITVTIADRDGASTVAHSTASIRP